MIPVRIILSSSIRSGIPAPWCLRFQLFDLGLFLMKGRRGRAILNLAGGSRARSLKKLAHHWRSSSKFHQIPWFNLHVFNLPKEYVKPPASSRICVIIFALSSKFKMDPFWAFLVVPCFPVSNSQKRTTLRRIIWVASAFFSCQKGEDSGWSNMEVMKMLICHYLFQDSSEDLQWNLGFPHGIFRCKSSGTWVCWDASASPRSLFQCTKITKIK